MESHSCRKCGTIVLRRNRICTRCGAAVNARPMPVFWFVFTAWLFVAYACLTYIDLV